MKKYSLYDSFSLEDVRNIGGVYRAKCLYNRGYEYSLTVGKIYDITMGEGILPMTPLCTLMGDDGKVCCHLTRFEKLEEVKE